MASSRATKDQKPAGGKARAGSGGSVMAAKAAQTRERLIEAAIAAFSAHGYDGVSVDSIAAAASINKQLIYHYFGSKAGLFKVALQQCYMLYRGDESAIARAASNPDPLLAIRELARFLFGRTPELLRFQRMVQDANIQGPAMLQGLEGVKEAYAYLIASVSSILDRGARTGVIRAGIDPVEFYVSLSGICGARVTNAMTLSYVLDIDLVTPEGAARSHNLALDLLIDGIRS